MNLKDKPPMQMLISNEYLQIIPSDKLLNYNRPLTISRSDLKIDADVKIKNEQTLPIFGIVGIYNVYAKPHLFLITQAKPIQFMNNATIYKIKLIQTIRQIYEKESLSSVETEQIQLICKYLSKCTYFSYDYDLTLPLNQQKKTDQMERSVRFWWNFNGLKPLISQNITKEWCLKIIQGYVGFGNITMKTCFSLKYNLISRREWHRGGTRYNHRGIDSEGYAANTIETEQIICYQEQKYSHLQLRGSVPIFWQQTGLSAISELTMNQELTIQGFLKHMNYLKKYYNKVICINLMAKDKPNEQLVNKHYSEIFKSCDLNYATYTHIDFHTICKNYKFQNLNPLIEKQSQILVEFQYTKIRQDILIQLQQGIIRTNCLDCLDRTNVFQNKVAIYVLQLILNDCGILLKNEFKCENLLEIAEDNKNKHPLILLIKELWSESGNAISKLYAGTNSSTTKLSKHGGNGFTGLLQNGITGLQRFYKQNFTDQQKQNIYNFIIGDINNQNDDLQGFVNLFQIKMLQRTIQNLLIMTVSMNMQNLTSSDINFNHFFDYQQQPDLLIICLQNVNTNCMPYEFMKNLIQQSLKLHLGQYEKILTNLSKWQYTFIYGKSQSLDLISKSKNEILQQDNINIGLHTELNYDSFRVVILNMNIEADDLPKYIYIMEEKLGEFDISILCGINNSKVMMEEKIVEQKQNNQDYISQLYQHDQICKYIQTIPFMTNFLESIITFPPNAQQQWPSRILYGSSICLDAFQEINYEEIKFKKRNGIRQFLSIDLCALDLVNKEKSIGQDDQEEMRFSQIFYNHQD